jgi:hypothetical protein
VKGCENIDNLDTRSLICHLKKVPLKRHIFEKIPNSIRENTRNLERPTSEELPTFLLLLPFNNLALSTVLVKLKRLQILLKSYVYIYIYIYIFVCVYVCVCSCMCVCICVFMCVRETGNLKNKHVNQDWQVKKFGFRESQFSILLWTCMLATDFYGREGHEL